MVEIAAKRNPSLIDVDRVDVVRSSVESLSFSDDVFDKAQRVHVLYFWKDRRFIAFRRWPKYQQRSSEKI
jgi:hypothetical protein